MSQSQSLRAIKSFRLRELTPSSSSSSRIILAPPNKPRIPPAATTASPNILQRGERGSEPAHPHGNDDGSSRRMMMMMMMGTGTGTGTGAAAALNNPFLPHKNPTSGRWAPPKYSLRRQAQLVKHARRRAAAGSSSSPTPTSTSTTPAPTSTSSADVGDRVELEEGKEVERGLVSVRLRQRHEETKAEAEDTNTTAAAAADAWRRQVEWVGTVRERNVAGSDVGNRLYAGKKRMFKGHKWERVRERRVARTRMLLRDMDKRVQRFKQYRAKGKPMPLARRSSVLKKTQKLPF
ncbi:hypothetical protein BC826DRAFT_1005060 [Russula brevipes]|nr:hypothetical protein BC826DRAFT_1005060 [Russula brevipes]